MANDSDRKHSAQSDDTLELRDIVLRVWRGKWIVIGLVAVASVLSVLYALAQPNIYRADAVLAPNRSEGAQGLQGLANQYSGLASLAGLSLPQGQGGSDRVAEGLEVLQSRRFLADFIERHNLLVPIMAAKEWDENADVLRYQEHLYDEASGKWVRKVRAPRQQTPTFLEAQQFFKDHFLSVSQDKKTGFVTIAVEFYSPQMASTWTRLLIDDLNREIMQRDVTQAENAIEYLNSQIEGTALADLRRVFSRLIEEQTKTIMLAAVSEEYLLKTLDPPVAPEFRSAPRRSVIVLASVFLAGVFGVLIALAVGGRRGT